MEESFHSNEKRDLTELCEVNDVCGSEIWGLSENKLMTLKNEKATCSVKLLDKRNNQKHTNTGD